MPNDAAIVSTSVLLYRRANLAYCDIARAAQILLSHVGASDERYDIIELTLAECGVTPKPSKSCNVVHSEEFNERVSAFADFLFDRIATNEGVHHAVTAVLLEVIANCTLEAPIQHLTKEERRAYVLCAVAETAGSASSYMDCAKRRAHVGDCSLCENRVERYALAMLKEGRDDDNSDNDSNV